MNQEIKIAFVGGDLRQVYCARSLAECGFETAVYACEKFSGGIGECTKCVTLSDAMENAQVAVLPLPCVDGNVACPLSDKAVTLDEILGKCKNAHIVLCGGNNIKAREFCEKNGIAFADYADRADFKIMNAEPTAEGTLAIAVNEMKRTLFGSRVLVVGYGRIGRVLCRMLDGIGSVVYASARRDDDLAWAKLAGLNAVKTSDLASVIADCDLILNTVPHTVITQELLSLVKPDALIIDLASKPGGIDFKPAKEMGLRVIWALSLPGKYSPITAGEILADTVMKILAENGICERSERTQ